MMEDYENIQRIISVWRRYQGIRHKDTTGKFYSFSDLDELERRIALYFQHKDKFNWNEGEVVFEEDEDE